MASRIGQFSLQRISGMPHELHQQMEVVSTAGIDGVAIWDTGQRAEPFTLTSVTDADTFQSAQILYEQYLALVGQDPVQIEFGGRLIAGVRFAVLSVRPLMITPVLLGVRNGAARYGRCEVEWMLQPVK